MSDDFIRTIPFIKRKRIRRSVERYEYICQLSDKEFEQAHMECIMKLGEKPLWFHLISKVAWLCLLWRVALLFIRFFREDMSVMGENNIDFIIDITSYFITILIEWIGYRITLKKRIELNLFEEAKKRRSRWKLCHPEETNKD